MKRALTATGAALLLAAATFATGSSAFAAGREGGHGGGGGGAGMHSGGGGGGGGRAFSGGGGGGRAFSGGGSGMRAFSGNSGGREAFRGGTAGRSFSGNAPAFNNRGVASNQWRGRDGRHDGRRFVRRGGRVFAFGGGYPYYDYGYYDDSDCYQWVVTPYGRQWVNVCGYDYDY
jgi:hypothetical protein